MPVNPFSAGTNALLQHLAEREMLRKQAEMEQYRRAQDLKDEQYRQAGLDLDRRNIEEYNAARREALDAQTRREQAQRHSAEAAAADLAGLTAMYYEAKNPEDQRKLEQQIVNRGGQVVKPADKRPERLSLEQLYSEAVQAGDQAKARVILKAIREEAGAKRAPEKPPTPETEKIDPEMVPDVAAYIDSLRSKVDDQGNPYDLARAREDLDRQFQKWHEQRRQGLRGDRPSMPKLLARLEKVFPAVVTTEPGLMGEEKKVTTYPGAAPRRPGGAGAASAPGAQAPVSDAQALEVLKQLGLEPTPENLQAAKDELAGQ